MLLQVLFALLQLFLFDGDGGGGGDGGGSGGDGGYGGSGSGGASGDGGSGGDAGGSDGDDPKKRDYEKVMDAMNKLHDNVKKLNEKSKGNLVVRNHQVVLKD